MHSYFCLDTFLFPVKRQRASVLQVRIQSKRIPKNLLTFNKISDKSIVVYSSRVVSSSTLNETSSRNQQKLSLNSFELANVTLNERHKKIRLGNFWHETLQSFIIPHENIFAH